MQVFIIGSPMETVVAMTGDTHRYNKQVVEIGQIIDALNGKKAWSRHPAVLQYRGYEKYLEFYLESLKHYQQGNRLGSAVYSAFAVALTPEWHCAEYYDQMKRRLFEKDELHYKQWSFLGKSLDNWYYIDGKFVKYRNGKRIA